jgi:hypothetical protein
MKIPTNGELFTLNRKEYKSTGCYFTREENSKGPHAAGCYLLAHRWMIARGDWAKTATKIHVSNWS